PERTIRYRALVLALGGVTPDLGVDGVLEHAILLDRATDAETLFRRFSVAMLAHSLPDNNNRLQVVIVGSGATGVELAAFLATDHQCACLAPRSSAPDIQVTVLEAMDTFMPSMPQPVRDAVSERLRAAGVETRTGQQVERIGPDQVETGEDGRFPADL